MKINKYKVKIYGIIPEFRNPICYMAMSEKLRNISDTVSLFIKPRILIF